MDNPTDAAVETLALQFLEMFHVTPGTTMDSMLVIARYVLTRQPGPEDVERIPDVIQIAWNKSHDSKFGVCLGDIQRAQARAILALYAPPPEDARACIGRLTLRVNELRAELEALENTPARPPTRSALDSALDPMLGNSPVRKAVVDAVLGLFESARRPLSEAQEKRGIYVASRASIPERGQMWRRFRSNGWPIISTWIDEDGEGETGDFGSLWTRIKDEVTGSAALILYAEAGDFPLKGALIEVGMALAANVPVFVVAPDVKLATRSLRPLGSWAAHPRVCFADSVEQALRATLEAEHAAASWPMTAPTDSAASDLLAWLEKTHVETMDQNLQLIVERDALNARVAELETELAVVKSTDDRRTGQLIDERDVAEEALSQAFYLVTGRSPEWSSMWGRQDALEEIGDACALLRESAAAKSPPPGAIRLGEGLTEAPHGYAAVAEAMRMAEQTTTLLREVMRTRAARRASATPKLEAVDWTQYAQEYIGGARAFDPDIIMTGLCEQIAALRVGGV